MCVCSCHTSNRKRKEKPTYVCWYYYCTQTHTHTQAQRMKCALRSRDGLHTTHSYSCPTKKGPHTNAQKAYVQRMIYKYDSSQFCGKRKGAQKWKEVKRAVCVCGTKVNHRKRSLSPPDCFAKFSRTLLFSGYGLIRQISCKRPCALHCTGGDPPQHLRPRKGERTHKSTTHTVQILTLT